MMHDTDGRLPRSLQDKHCGALPIDEEADQHIVFLTFAQLTLPHR